MIAQDNNKYNNQDSKQKNKSTAEAGNLSKPDKNMLVARRNDLIFSRYKLTLQEMRVMLWLFSEIRSDDKAFRRYRISVRDFADMVGLEGGSIYSTIPEITSKLMQRIAVVNDLDEKVIKQRPFLIAADYQYGSGYVEVELHPDMKNYLLNLKEGNFTKVPLDIALRLKSGYSLRLYEILSANLFKGSKTSFDLSDLRELLGVEVGQYDRFNNFKARVLEPATKEVHNRTDLSVEYGMSKMGNAVDKVVFNVKRRAAAVGYAAGTRKDKLFAKLRQVGMLEAEAMRAIEHWADVDPGRIEFHVDECRTKKSPLGWLRSGLKKDFRDNRPLFDWKKKAAETRAAYQESTSDPVDEKLRQAIQAVRDHVDVDFK